MKVVCGLDSYPSERSSLYSLLCVYFILSDFLVRPGQDRDIPLLADIEQAGDQLFPAGRLPDTLTTFPLPRLKYAAFMRLLFVAERNESLVGFAVSSRVRDYLHLNQVSVHPDAGRRGIGRRLVETIIAKSVELELKGVTLSTFADIPWNGPFYTKIGFRPITLQDDLPELKEMVAKETKFGLTGRIGMLYVNI